MLHTPILIETFLSFFADKQIETFVDGTLGAGGHAKALLESHPEIQRFYGFDQDEEALGIAKKTLEAFAHKVVFINENFRQMRACVEEQSVDGIFLDIGVSSMQLDQVEKGFSFSKEGPLDMRMDPSQDLDAEKIVNSFSEKELGAIFRDLGEERRWRAAAKAVVEARRKKRLRTTLDLAEALKNVLTWGGQKKKIHPMTLVFQALRIYVNDELGAIEETIPIAIDLLASGGRMGVIAFHSLEDRIVKHTFIQYARQEKTVQLLTKKPLIADSDEIKKNPRSRSAKMRFIEKV